MKMQDGLTFSSTGASGQLPWGAVLSAGQARWVTITSSGPTYRWGVWRQDGGAPLFPVRSTNGGTTWTAAGPQLATDWAGGALYYVSKVLAISPTSVAMVSNSVLDVTTDSGHHWYQYLNALDNWNFAVSRLKDGRIGLRVSPASYARLPKSSYALYVLNVAQHRWIRTSESLS